MWWYWRSPCSPAVSTAVARMRRVRLQFLRADGGIADPWLQLRECAHAPVEGAEVAARHVQQLMRELVKHDGGQFRIVPAQHRVENGIVEMAQSGIGRHPRHTDVETL